MSSLNGLTASSLPDCVCFHSFDRYTIAKSQQSHALSVPALSKRYGVGSFEIFIVFPSFYATRDTVSRCVAG